MKFGTPRFLNERKGEEKKEIPPAELAFMGRRWYHGSPKVGIKKLRPGAWLPVDGDGVHISLNRNFSEGYGENISEWKLKGPLKIVSFPELADVNKKALRRDGYVGIYMIDEDGVGSGVVWNGRDLEKVTETKSSRPPKGK